MYKIICNNLVIDVINKPKYLRYLSKSGKTVITDRSSAHCIMGSNNKVVYILQGKMACPEGKDWKTVTLERIDTHEYNELLEILKSNELIYADKSELRKIQSNKINEMNIACRNAIVNGVTVLFSDNKLHYFELTIEDQINLMSIESDIKNGAKEILYHEKGSICKLYSSSDIQLLINTANKHKTYHTTYFNLLKNYILSIQDIDMINNIYYGIELPENISNKLKKLLK